MPMYTWACESCGREEDVIRPFEESDVPPSAEDIGPEDLTCEHKWAKVVRAPKWVRGAGWRGAKGHWLWLLCFLAASLA